METRAAPQLPALPSLGLEVPCAKDLSQRPTNPNLEHVSASRGDAFSPGDGCGVCVWGAGRWGKEVLQSPASPPLSWGSGTSRPSLPPQGIRKSTPSVSVKNEQNITGEQGLALGQSTHTLTHMHPLVSTVTGSLLHCLRLEPGRDKVPLCLTAQGQGQRDRSISWPSVLRFCSRTGLPGEGPRAPIALILDLAHFRGAIS